MVRSWPEDSSGAGEMAPGVKCLLLGSEGLRSRPQLDRHIYDPIPGRGTQEGPEVMVARQSRANHWTLDAVRGCLKVESQAVVMLTFYPSTWESETDRSL